MIEKDDDVPSVRVFERAAELFGLLATPVRLRIVSALCQGEKNVTELRFAAEYLAASHDVVPLGCGSQAASWFAGFLSYSRRILWAGLQGSGFAGSR